LLRCDAEWQLQSAAARERYTQRFTAAHFEERLLRALQALP
jgi:hypothetical protein